MKSLKRNFEPWRSFLVALSSFFTWDQPWCPAVLVCVVTSLFLARWYWQPSVLTSVGIIGVIATLSDYLGPRICNSVSPPERWTAAQEKQYENFCYTVVGTQDMLYGNKAYLKTLKESSPKIYFGVLFSIFIALAWIGYVVNNWILLYIFGNDI